MKNVKRKKIKAVTIDQMSDKNLASMIRNSVYAEGTQFGEGKNDSQFLLVVAVPYGKSDEVNTRPEAIESFVELFRSADWQERNIQLYDHRKGTVFNTSYEVEIPAQQAKEVEEVSPEANDTVAALRGLLEQVYQMRGMFPDEDHAIANAVKDAEEAIEEVSK